jgi:hypothetical protein
MRCSNNAQDDADLQLAKFGGDVRDNKERSTNETGATRKDDSSLACIHPV